MVGVEPDVCFPGYVCCEVGGYESEIWRAGIIIGGKPCWILGVEEDQAALVDGIIHDLPPLSSLATGCVGVPSFVMSVEIAHH